MSFMVIHPIAVEILQSGSKCSTYQKTDIVVPIQSSHGEIYIIMSWGNTTHTKQYIRCSIRCVLAFQYFIFCMCLLYWSPDTMYEKPEVF